MHATTAVLVLQPSRARRRAAGLCQLQKLVLCPPGTMHKLAGCREGAAHPVINVPYIDQCLWRALGRAAIPPCLSRSPARRLYPQSNLAIYLRPAAALWPACIAHAGTSIIRDQRGRARRLPRCRDGVTAGPRHVPRGPQTSFDLTARASRSTGLFILADNRAVYDQYTSSWGMHSLMYGD